MFYFPEAVLYADECGPPVRLSLSNGVRLGIGAVLIMLAGYVYAVAGGVDDREWAVKAGLVAIWIGGAAAPIAAVMVLVESWSVEVKPPGSSPPR